MLSTSIQTSLKLDQTLAPYAIKHSIGKARFSTEPEDLYRTRFQLDRDRVLHSKSFRRLKNKTQVFTPSTGDHFRDRLTHTLEVSQIARSLARMLAVNEDLAEVIALAHDLGHTPFGHAGEYALRDCLSPFNIHFEHNEQSLHLVQTLNLNPEVIEGLQKHQTPYDQSAEKFINASVEAQIVNFADEIAYHNHDFDDGIRSGILDPADYTQLSIYQLISPDLPNNFNPVSDRHIFISKIMKLMIQDLAQETDARITAANISSLEDVYSYSGKIVDFSATLAPVVKELRNYLYQNFYHHHSVTAQTNTGKTIIKSLFDFYMANPTELPEQFRTSFETSENPAIIVKDYIAGMTDPFAHSKYKQYALS